MSDMTKHGGRFVSHAAANTLFAADVEGYWNFGYLQSWEVPDQVRLSLENTFTSIQPYKHVPDYNGDDPVNLTTIWSHPSILQVFGKAFLGFGQEDGSCVGAGGGNILATLSWLEILLLAESERLIMPSWLLTYGRSRFYCGMRTPGAGSLESCWRKAALEDGFLPMQPDLPQYYDEGGSVQVGYAAERRWSDGDEPLITNRLSTSRQYPITKAESAQSADDVWNAIGAFKVVGHGSMYGYSVTGKADDGIAIGRRGPRWSHKETILGRRMIGSKRYFLNVNQWFYQGAKLVWIPEEDVQWLCDTGEVEIYSGLKGVPEDKIDWRRLW